MLHWFINLFFLLFGERVNVGDPEQTKKRACAAGWAGAREACDECGVACFCGWAKGVTSSGGAGAKGPWGGFWDPPRPG